MESETIIKAFLCQVNKIMDSIGRMKQRTISGDRALFGFHYGAGDYFSLLVGFTAMWR